MNNLNAKLANSQFIHLSDTRTLFHGRDALPLLIVKTPLCDAIIALQGAQLLRFAPKNQTDWLWLSPYARFEKGQSIRGGIPVCLPWFGVNRQHPEKPKHGFVRNDDWQLAAIEESGEQLVIDLDYHYSGNKPELFSHAFSARLRFIFSEQLQLQLSLHNHSDSSAEFSWALHSYFAVEHCERTRVSGLENIAFLDNTQGLKPCRSATPVTFFQEVDSVYNATTVPQIIQNSQTLEISGNNCPTCIVWNAGREAAKNITDIGDSVQQYICVERGCAFSDSLTLSANAQYHSTMLIRKI